MNAPPRRDLYDLVARTEEADDHADTLDPAYSIPLEVWGIAALLTLAALNALRLILA